MDKKFNKFVIIIYWIIITFYIFCKLINNVGIIFSEEQTFYFNKEKLNIYNDEIKKELLTLNYNIPENATIKEIIHYLHWDNDEYVVIYEYQGETVNINSTKLPSIMSDGWEKNSVKKNKTIVYRCIIELIILFGILIVYSIFKVFRKIIKIFNKNK